MTGYFFTFGAFLLYSSVIGEDRLSEKNEATKSLTAIANLFLQRRDSDVEELDSILVFPVQLMMDVYQEYEYRERVGFSDVPDLEREMHIETNFTYFLDEFYYDFKQAARDSYARKYAYLSPDPYNPVPDRNISQDERIRFAFKCYVRWLRAHPDHEAAKKAIKLPPILTMVALRIHDLQSEPFQWSERVKFFTWEPTFRPMEVEVLRGINTFGYAEFGYPQASNCLAGALRLKVSPQLAVIFVIPLETGDRACSAPKTLLKTLQDIDFLTISFKPKRLFISIPIIKTVAVVNAAKHLKKLRIIQYRAYDFEYMQSDFDRYLSMALIFDPEVRPNSPIPDKIPEDVTRFQVERPFLVAVLQAGNRVPLMLGLVQNPINDVDMHY